VRATVPTGAEWDDIYPNDFVRIPPIAERLEHVLGANHDQLVWSLRIQSKAQRRGTSILMNGALNRNSPVRAGIAYDTGHDKMHVFRYDPECKERVDEWSEDWSGLNSGVREWIASFNERKLPIKRNQAPRETEATASQPATTPPRYAASDAIRYRNGPPGPASIEGSVFELCALGPNGQEELFDVAVLDTPIPRLCSDRDDSPCATNVVMLTVIPASSGRSLVGRHVRLSASEYYPQLTGHHHTRMLLLYDRSEDRGPARYPSLRAAWPRVRSDLSAELCKGWPR
jgi:hypothetical protein